ncbi:MAG: TerB family tellurite resistance protein [Parvularcula sp.]|jgi:uncharacterized tellurite resistance protein B-like protein|nr:TerB family tellurite resistance protein [Parvularcula sp.]
MVIENFTLWLRPPGADAAAERPACGPKTGAAALLVGAAHRDGHYSGVERDLVTAALMKLFMLSNPDARALRLEAEKVIGRGTDSAAAAQAASELETETREALVRHLWAIGGKNADALVAAASPHLGFSAAQADVLRPAEH